MLELSMPSSPSASCFMLQLNILHSSFVVVRTHYDVSPITCPALECVWCSTMHRHSLTAARDDVRQYRRRLSQWMDSQTHSKASQEASPGSNAEECTVRRSSERTRCKFIHLWLVARHCQLTYRLWADCILWNVHRCSNALLWVLRSSVRISGAYELRISRSLSQLRRQWQCLYRDGLYCRKLGSVLRRFHTCMLHDREPRQARHNMVL